MEDVDATLAASDAADVEEDDDNVDNDEADSDEDTSNATTGACVMHVHVDPLGGMSLRNIVNLAL